MNILSIDWDYFFPNSVYYDWAANEEQSFFYEAIWSTRCYTRNLATKKEALFEYVPQVPNNFWSIVTNKPKIFVAESHFTLWHLLSKVKRINSLDAHHDCGYRQKEIIDCGNWGEYSLLFSKTKELHIHYPSWREKDKESEAVTIPTSISCNLPKPQDYSFIFICRSGCWTPPWKDIAFKRFVMSSNFELKIMDNMVWKKRSPNLKQAIQIRKETKKIFDTFQRKAA